MSQPVSRERELFELALDQPEARRVAFLRDQCGADDALLRRVMDLLGVSAGKFLGGVAGEMQPAAEPEVPRQIGRYRIIERLGEGGFGVVYLAEQSEPVRRRVALKVLKPGVESRQVIARFEAERQVLALMDHPNIARVFDAGATEDGKPFFVMELVPGPPLTRFCDDERYSVRERLLLFCEVCDALQHAHQKGVIHRDLKPSNVLVFRQDQRVVPKVIDFGVAKATQPESGTAPGVTRAFELLGTPAYMSPEQARMLGRDVDIRTDIYSLGVLLHELLIGRTPLDARELDASALDVWRRRICEEEPLRPSLRWRSLPILEQNESSSCRRTTTVLLGRQLTGDLDWIVLRCLEKDRERRYPSAAALAADIRRHLADEPVEAAAPGALYRVRKFLRRHRLAVGAAAIVLIAMTAATVLSVSLAWRATMAERTAEQLLENEQRQRVELERLRRLADDEAATARAVTRFLNEDLLGVADPGREPERELTLRSVLDRASRQLEDGLTNNPAVAAAIHETLGRAYQNLAAHESAARHYESARGLFARLHGPSAPDAIRTAVEAAFSRHRAGDSLKALADLEATTAMARARLGRKHPMSIHAGQRLAWTYYNFGRIADWEREAEETFSDMNGVEGVSDADVLGVMYLVGRKRGTVRGGVFEEGEKVLLRILDLMHERRGADHPLTIRARAFLAVYYYDHWRNVDRAEAMFRDVYDWQRRVLGETHEQTLVNARNLGLLYGRAGRIPEALRMHFHVLSILPGDSATLNTLHSLSETTGLTAGLQAVGDLRWRGTSLEPAATWTALEFNDAEWPTTMGQGTAAAWWRAEFNLGQVPSDPLVVNLRGAKRCQVWFNGVPLAGEVGGVRGGQQWVVSTRDATRALRPGRNVLAIRIVEMADDAAFGASLFFFPAVDAAMPSLR